VANDTQLCVISRKPGVAPARTPSCPSDLFKPNQLNPAADSRFPIKNASLFSERRRLKWFTTYAAIALLLAFAPRICAQVTIGDDLSMNLNGTISGGYTADYGNFVGSAHGFTAGGTADLSGSYYDPNFVSFHLQPYYNESRANSNYQSISDTSGVNASAAIFSGSHFPGTISYSKNYNSEGNYGIPGIANYVTHGNADTFAVGWGINLPDKPTLGLSFLEGHNQYSIYGTDTNGASAFQSFGANSTYTLAGFNLNGSYHYTGNHSEIPNFIPDEPSEQTSTSSNSFGFGVAHRLPLNGAFSAGVNRSDTGADFPGGNFNATIDTFNGGLSFNPIEKLNFGTNVQYNDNLNGTLYNAVVSAGGVIPENNLHESSHSLDVNNYVNYRLPLHLTLSGTIDHRQQEIFGTSIADNAYTGTLSYANSLLGGFVSAVGGVTENVVNVHDQTMLGFLGSVNYSRRVGRWNFSGGFNYSQNQQTLLITYTTSGYGYNAGIGRKIGRWYHWGASASGSKGGLTNVAGTGTFTQSYSTTLGLNKWATFTGTYSKSSGNAILTGSGLVPTPIPVPIVTPSSVILYGGHSYSGGIGSSPIRRLTISGSYARAFSDTISSALNSNNRTQMVVTTVDYQFRQIHFQAGWDKLVQGFSLSGLPPTMLGSYYAGIWRYFNFF
jgi:hypothetical protein